MGQGGGAVYAPPASEAITQDADGNLTGDGRWAYTWDSENRLIAMETKPALVSAGAPRQGLEFGYDAGHRRISKVVKSFSSSLNAWSVASQTLYLYDGWNLIAEFDASPSLPVSLSPRLLRSYEWGLDLSGTMTGAGGVGGLLIIRSHSTANNSQPLQTTSTSSHAHCYDGNGNLSALVNLATGQTEARYDYGPFGERVLAAGGAIAEANPFRFSTKYEDPETGLLYYGYRFYDSAAGRWINRDPIGERGGVNVIGMVEDDPVNRWDSLGQYGSGISPLAGINSRPFDHEAWIAEVGNVADGLPRRLLHHWSDGDGADYTLSKDEFRSVAQSQDADLMKSSQFKADLKKLKTDRHFSGEYSVPTDATMARTLGNYLFIMKVEVVCDASNRNAFPEDQWRAEGTIEGGTKDLMRYDFNEATPPKDDEGDVTKMLLFQQISGMGTDFDIISPVVPFKQRGGDGWGQIDW